MLKPDERVVIGTLCIGCDTGNTYRVTKVHMSCADVAVVSYGLGQSSGNAARSLMTKTIRDNGISGSGGESDC